MEVFKAKSYISFIKKQINDNHSVYGYKAKLAEAMGAQRSYLSQILNEKVHITLEQAERLSRYWRLTSLESEYFLDLVSFDKAGSNELREIYSQRLNKMKNSQTTLAVRYEKENINIEHQAIYYSSWMYSAVHILLTVPTFNNIQQLSERLSVSPEIIHKILIQLEKMNLVKNEKNRWFSLDSNIHIGNNSMFNTINHKNWREKANLSSLSQSDGHIHYTSVYSLSLSDIQKIKEMILDCIDKTRKIVGPSKEEEVVCFNCDFFKV